MDSKQYNFFPNKEELDKLEKYLQSKGFILLSVPAKELPFQISEQIIQNQKDIWPIRYITQNKFLEKVNTKYIEEQNYYTIDVISSPVIELVLPKNMYQKKESQQSRVYFVTSYFDSNKKWIEKDSEFIALANNILKWSRKNFKNRY